MGPSSVIMGFDPMHILLKNHYPSIENLVPSKCIVFVVRLLWSTWLYLEGSRISIYIIVLTMALCKFYIRCITLLASRRAGEFEVLMYIQLQYINQVGMHTISLMVGSIMSGGVVLLVLGNWFIISGWGSYPTEIYLAFTVVTLLMYVILWQTLPLAVEINEMSTSLLLKWKNQLTGIGKGKKILLKRIRAQRSVAIHYVLTKLERNTKRNFFAVVFDFSVDLMLLN